MGGRRVAAILPKPETLNPKPYLPGPLTAQAVQPGMTCENCGRIWGLEINWV